MSERQCWTCGSAHDLDEACAQSNVARSARGAGGEAAVSSLLFSGAPSRLAPVRARFDSECAKCGYDILIDSWIRADGDGGWEHARDEECE